MGPTYAGILGPLAFVLVLARGLIGGDGTDGTLLLASCCLVAFAAVGYVTGRLADWVLWDSVKQQFQHEMQAREARQAKPSSRAA